MVKLKILFITGEYSHSIGQRTDIYFIKELSKHVDLFLCYHTGNIHDILREINVIPDFILLNDIYLIPSVEGLSSINIPKGIIIHDPHRDIEYRKQFIKDNNIDYLFSITRDAFYKYYPELISKMYWHPHFINPEIYKDYGLKKDIDYLLMGYIDPYYPLRKLILDTMKDEPGFVYHGHPGYKPLNDSTFNNIYVDERYAVEISRAKIFLTDDSILHYVIMKYYEVPACNTLLLAPSSKELEDLGFIPGTHFVEINENNFLEKARYYLQHEEERKRIAQNGYDMVHSKHTVQKRVENFLNVVSKAVLQ